MTEIAKIFWSGRSQAVRLPKEFRFEGTEVSIRREGSRVILTPTETDYAEADVGVDVARGIEELRMLIAKGEDTAGDAEWNLDDIVRNAREGFVPETDD